MRGLTVLFTTIAFVVVIALAAGVWVVVSLLSAPGPAPLDNQSGPSVSGYGSADGAPALPAMPAPAGSSAQASSQGPDAAEAVGDTEPAEGSPAALFAVDREWADEMSARTGISARALSAYAGASEWAKSEYSTCGIGWNTIAGLGWVESHHGTIDGSSIDADGIARPKIIGVPLDGKGDTARIPDTDGGALDGDEEFDRAVGPLQFIPETWQRFAVDARGTGSADPHSVDDAAFTAARYLCGGGRDLTADDDWVSAILAYNASRQYADDVFSAAEYYAQA